jgi:plastocyanin
MRLQLFGLPLLAAVAATPVPTGSVSGQVTLVSGGAIRPNASAAVVWIEGARRAAAPVSATATAPREEMKSDQKRFAPRVVAIPRSATVDFPNADPIFHNVFSVSGANRFDLGLYRSGASRSKQFDEAGLVRVYCNIHPQMVGFVMVVDSDFEAVTGTDGKFRFDGVPAGAWTLRVWHEEGGETAIPVSVRAGADATAAVRLDTSAYKPQAHKNKYGKDYPAQAASDDERY